MLQDHQKLISSLLQKLKYCYGASILNGLLCDILHKMSNHLSVLSLSIDDTNDYLAEKGLKDNYLSKKLQQQSRTVNKITSIISDLRTYVRRGKETSEKISVNQVISNCIDILEPIYSRENITYNRLYSNIDPVIRGQYFQLQHALMNLFVNATYSLLQQGGGTINIDLEEDQNLIKILITWETSPSTVELASYLHKELFTIDDTRDENNLNYNFTSALIKDLDGSISVCISPENELTFTILLANASHILLASEEAYYKKDIKKMSGQILVVDDEKDMLNIMKRYLTGIGFEVDIAENGLIGLEYLSNKTYKFLITDLKMPELSGEKMLEIATSKDYLKDTIVLVITGCFINQDSDDGYYLRDKVKGFIYKPFSKDKIFETLKKYYSED